MRDIPEVKRWTEATGDAPHELAELLRAGRDALGTPPEVAQLARRLSTVLGPASGLPGGAAPVEPEPPDVGARGATVGAAPGAGDGTPALAQHRPSAAGLGRLGAWVAAGTGVAIGVWLVASALTGAPGTAPPASIQGGPAPHGAVAPAASVPAAPAPAASSGASPAAGVPPDAATPNQAGAGVGGTTAASSRARAAAPVPRSRPATLAEAELLQRAQAALRADPAAALELARRHQQRFPHGALVQEREVIAIEALKRLGRLDAASSRAAAFERRYSGSLHRARVERGSDTPAPARDGLHGAP